MKQLVVITTDGAIIMKDGPIVGGAVPALKGEQLLARLPHTDITLRFEEFSNVPSSHFIPMRGLELARRIDQLLNRNDVDGVVVTHGTDTLEETAYLLDLTLRSSKPVVLTGTSRSPNENGYDGIANLSNAILVAASDTTLGMGVLVVFGTEIHAASTVQAVYTQTTNIFQSPGSGPLGRVVHKQVRLSSQPLRPPPLPNLSLNETVDLIRVTQGADDRQLRHSMADGVAGIVIEALGSGRVPPWWLPAISDALTQRIAVVVCSRCTAGGLGDDHGYVGGYHDLRRLKVLLAHNLSGVKARIKLMLALGAARHDGDLRQWFG